MATGTINGVKYNTSANYSTSGNRWLQFKYSTSITGPGKTKVTWTLKSMYDGSTSVRSLLTNYALRINGEVKCTIKQADRRYVSYNNGNDYSGQLGEPVNESGSFTVTHDSSGKGTFKVKLTSAIYSSTLSEVEKTITLPTNYPYTACSAPTSVSIGGLTSGYFKSTTTSLTLSWSGAKAGTANSIKGYKIYYAVGETPDTDSSSVTVDSTATSGSKTITLPSMSSGQYIKFAIITLGSAGGSYNSGFSSSKPSAIKNTPPSTPSVSVNKNALPSSGGTVTFTITKGGETDSSQTETFYYSTSLNSTKVKCGANFTTSTITKDVDYTFWSYDGLEYSLAARLISIKINQLPTIGGLDIEETTYEYDNVDYFSNFNVIIKNARASTNTDASNSIVSQRIYCEDKNGNIIQNSIRNSSNISSYIPPTIQNFYIVGEVKDEFGDIKKIKSKLYEMPATATMEKLGVVGTSFDSTITDNTYFDKYIRFSFPYDTMYTTDNLLISFEGKKISTFEIDETNKKVFCNCLVNAKIEEGTNPTFSIEVNCNNIIRNYTFSNSLTKIKTFNLTPTSYSKNISSFSTSDYSFILNPQGLTFNETQQLNSFGLTGIDNLSIIFEYNGEEHKIIASDNTEGKFYLDTSSTNDKLILILNDTGVKEIIKELGIVDELNDINITYTIELTNKFKEQSYSLNNIITFQMFSKIFESLKEKNFTFNGEKLENTSTIIRENIEGEGGLEWSFTIDTYHKQTIKAIVDIYYSDNKISLEGLTPAWINNYHTEIIKIDEKRGEDLIISQTISIKKLVEEINKSQYVYYKIRFENIDNIQTTNTSIERIYELEKNYFGGRNNKCIAPSILNLETSYNNDTKIIEIKNNIDPGLDINSSHGRLKYQIEYIGNNSEGNKFYEYSELMESLEEVTINYPVTDFKTETANFELNISSLFYDEEINSTNLEDYVLKKTITIPLIVYNLIQTVHLQKNQVGINTKEFSVFNDGENKEVFVVKQYADYNIISLIGEDKIITINLEDGSITGAEITGTIINNCNINNCEIDGGTW